MGSYEIEPNQYAFVKREILSLTGVDLNFYKTTQVQRRLGSYLVRSGHSTWVDFFRETKGDPEKLSKLKDYLTINVSSFFRDPSKFECLEKKVLPELMRERARVQVWSAGCSLGQEAYTLALMLEKIAPVSCRYEILATDIDRSALELAGAGGPYSKDDVANVPAGMLRRHFEERDGGYWVGKEIRRRVTFRHLNLLSDRFERGFDLIVCRNVVIYFTAPVKEKLYRRFYEALRPGGVLFVGGTEIVSKASDMGFQSNGISFYRRAG